MITDTTRRSSLVQWTCAAFLAWAAMGCNAAGMVQTAQTLGKGGWEVSVDPGVNGVFGLPVAGPIIHGAFRYGVTDKVDLGLRVGSNIAEFQSKFLLTEPENPTIAVSLAPAIGAYYEPLSFGLFSSLNVPVPVLIGFKFGQHELTLGPRLQNNVYFFPITDGGRFYVLSAGLSLGFAAQLGETFRMLPELSVLTPLMISGSDGNGGTESTPLGVGAFSFSFNLGLQFGSARKKLKQTNPPAALSRLMLRPG
jgi:hypothetical protein